VISAPSYCCLQASKFVSLNVFVDIEIIHWSYFVETSKFYVLTLPTYKVFMWKTWMSEGTLRYFVWYHFSCMPCLCPKQRDERNVF